MTRTLNLLSMLMVVLFAGSLQAQIIATDDFEAATITDSKMSGGSGFDGDWILRGTAKTDFSIVEQSLQYDSGDIKVEGGKKALECVERVPSLIGVSVADMGRIYIEKKQQYKRTKGASNQLATRLQKGHR